MDFAVIRIAGKQHLVTVGDRVSLQTKLGAVGDALEIPEVLLLNTADTLKIGTPLVTGAKVHSKIIFVGRGEKIDVMKFKAKSRYRRKVGFRSDLTKIEIISLDGHEEAKPEETKDTKPAAKSVKKAAKTKKV